ncbi:hypothetical protein ACT3S2_14125 [Arthrobacter sp. AOP36-A1-22]|uniref:hypothetical protein n=1 Tax=unclassified Arthrobacter TaxID=235627 RepID=UPI0040340A2C
MSLGATLVSLGFGIVSLALGIAAYSGRDKSWMITKSVLPGQSGPALLYIGISFTLLPFTVPLMDVMPPILALLLGGTVLVCLFIGFIGFFWLPRFMHPRWMREQYRAEKERKREVRASLRRMQGN